MSTSSSSGNFKFPSFYNSTKGSTTDISSAITKVIKSLAKAGLPFYSTYSELLYGIDNIGSTNQMPEMEHHGFTFFTRPKLNLSTPSIRMDRNFAILDTLETSSPQFAIRALLDRKLTTLYGVTDNSDLFNPHNPFIPILTNRVMNISGWPVPVIDTETITGGFYGESLTIPTGYDQLSRNYDITATFSDIQGGFIIALFSVWFNWIWLCRRGRVMRYIEDIEFDRMSYTSSIYRLILDPSGKYVTKWAKATGCWPRSNPVEGYFNYDRHQPVVDASMNLSIPFTISGKVDYFPDPIALQEFNMCVEECCPQIKSYKKATMEQRKMYKTRCIPYINLTDGYNELEWRFDPNDSSISSINSIAS